MQFHHAYPIGFGDKLVYIELLNLNKDTISPLFFFYGFFDKILNLCPILDICKTTEHSSMSTLSDLL